MIGLILAMAIPDRTRDGHAFTESLAQFRHQVLEDALWLHTGFLDETA